MIKINKLLEEFSKLDIKLIAGKEKTEKEVDYISILELPEQTGRFKEKGLILSTFQSFKHVDDIKEQIHWLQTVGVLGIGFHTAHYKNVPEEVIKYADDINIPLISIPVDIPYHKILDIFNQLENEQLNLKGYEIYKLNDKIMESVFLGKDPGYIINLMGNYLRDNIIFLDTYLTVKAVWKVPEYSQEYMDCLTSKLTSLHKEKLLQTRFFKKEVRLTIDEPYKNKITLKIIPIEYKDVFGGYLLVNESTLESFYNNEVVRMGIKAISMSGHKQPAKSNHLRLRDIKNLETLIENESNNLTDSDFYISISQISYCIRVLFSNKAVMEEAFNSISNVTVERELNVLTWIFKDTLIVYVERKDEVLDLLDILNMYSVTAVGISSIFEHTSLSDIRIMNLQAQTAMYYSAEHNGVSCEWDTLGIEKVAYNIKGIPLFKSLHTDILNPIIECDQQKSSDLFRTLDSCLSHFFNIKAAADELFIHPNTVRYRLGQIKELLNIDINKRSNFALLVLAIEIYKNN